MSEILALPSKPKLRRAKLVRYSTQTVGGVSSLNGWSDGGAIVEGMVYNVEHEKHAERLAEIRNASLPRITMFDPLYRW